ncbi:MAG: GNAT family N-acetyltransferase [Byssovorax sp.]
MALQIRKLGPDELRAAASPISVAFGLDLGPERLTRLEALTELDQRFGAFDGATIVGAVNSYGFEMTVPGGAALPVAGTTLVGVLPTHRRRGVLRALMRSYLDDVRERGKPLAALFASEASIYGRFGYGLASFAGEIELDRASADFAHKSEDGGRARFVSIEEAMEILPPIWERVRRATPGMLSRTPAWWNNRRLSDLEWQRQGRGPLQRVVIEIDDHPAAYAIYRATMNVEQGRPRVRVDLSEAIGDSPRAVRAVWRYLLDLDLLQTIKASLLPVDHPLLHLLAEPRALHMRIEDALFVRLVDVGAALSARTCEPGEPITLAVEDRFCPWNDGHYTLAEGRAEKTHEVADLALGVDALGSAYLGAFSFDQLLAAGRARELTEGAAARADRLFRRGRAPWCPDMF